MNPMIKIAIRHMAAAGMSGESILKAVEDMINWEEEYPISKKAKRIKSKAWAKIRRAVIERDGDLCSYCGNSAWPIHIDHVLPISRGGSNEMSNLAVSCPPCNIKKSDRTLEELGWIV